MVKDNLHHPFTPSLTVKRLVEECEKYGKIVVAFDFDNTIFDYHNNGGNYSQVINLLHRCSEQGWIMVLFTSNDDEERLQWMKEYCHHFGIRVDYINESPIMKTKKPYYNVLLDDRAGLYEVYDVLEAVLNIINEPEH